MTWKKKDNQKPASGYTEDKDSLAIYGLLSPMRRLEFISKPRYLLFGGYVNRDIWPVGLQAFPLIKTVKALIRLHRESNFGFPSSHISRNPHGIYSTFHKHEKAVPCLLHHWSSWRHLLRDSLLIMSWHHTPVIPDYHHSFCIILLKFRHRSLPKLQSVKISSKIWLRSLTKLPWNFKIKGGNWTSGKKIGIKLWSECTSQDTSLISYFWTPSLLNPIGVTNSQIWGYDSMSLLTLKSRPSATLRPSQKKVICFLKVDCL